MNRTAFAERVPQGTEAGRQAHSMYPTPHAHQRLLLLLLLRLLVMPSTSTSSSSAAATGSRSTAVVVVADGRQRTSQSVLRKKEMIR